MFLSELGEHWRGARAAPDVVHLDSAAAARCSTSAIDAVTAHLVDESRRGAYVVAQEAADRIEACRSGVARLTGHSSDQVTFTESASAALGSLLASWAAPTESASVWVGVTEYGPNLSQFERAGHTVTALPTGGEHGRIDVEALAGMLRTAARPPDLIHLCAIGSHSGIVQPMAAIVDVAHQAGVPVVLDAAQGLGHVDCRVGAEAVYGTSRKWLAGPRGVGVLAVSPGWLARSPMDSSDAFVAGRVGLGAAVAGLAHLGAAVVATELATIGARVRERLDGAGGWRVIEPWDERSAITTLEPPDRDDASAVRRARAGLYESGVLVTVAEPWRAPLSTGRTVLRLSPHLDVEDRHIDRVADYLER